MVVHAILFFALGVATLLLTRGIYLLDSPTRPMIMLYLAGGGLLVAAGALAAFTRRPEPILKASIYAGLGVAIGASALIVVSCFFVRGFLWAAPLAVLHLVVIGYGVLLIRHIRTKAPPAATAP